jgi:hypothetical protein
MESVAVTKAASWLLALVLLIVAPQFVQAAVPVECKGGDLPFQMNRADPPKLKVTGPCNVRAGAAYYYDEVNILEGGTLSFIDKYPKTPVEFWARSIIIENQGSLIASGDQGRSFGWGGSVLFIYLYGENKAHWDRNTQTFTTQNKGAMCQSPVFNKANVETAPCGIPKVTIWDPNGNTVNPISLPGGVSDWFYKYGPLYGDALCDDDKSIFFDGACRNASKQPTNAKAGYFGNKVLAVSFGATLSLAGHKGATDEHDVGTDFTSSGKSWTRLADGHDLNPGDKSLIVETAPGNRWQVGDEIVVTTTDYLPGHSERLEITGIEAHPDGAKISFTTLDSPRDDGALWFHSGTRYGGRKDKGHEWTTGTQAPGPGRLPYRLQTSIDWNLVTKGAETRAAVALLSRSIKIISGGNKAGAEFPTVKEDPTYSYGAHMVIRQGFKKLEVSGVEFVKMGQGGRLGHYPVHFHMARKTALYNYIKDSSVNEAMTRWFVLHSTQGATLARNVGYKSIGHGYYLEDGTETDNRFYSNIGIFARAAVANAQNPRKIPGILADNTDPETLRPDDTKPQGFPYRSDVEHPTIFWISNGWNDFIGNMAAGAGTCGAAYWFVPAVNRDHIEVTDDDHKFTPMKWQGYAGLQKAGMPRNTDFAGTTPLRTFYKNYATSTMLSFQTTGDAAPCKGVVVASAKPHPDGRPTLKAVESDAPKYVTKNKREPKPPAPQPPYTEPDNLNDHYYPQGLGTSRFATRCPPTADGKGFDCAKVDFRCVDGHLDNCAVTVLDNFTTSFHWSEGNNSAVWLRPQWYLLTNSVISDVQNGGLTFITGGDYTKSSMVPGYWAVARNTIFIGNSRPNPDAGKPDTKKFAYMGNAGPFNAISGLKCDSPADPPGYCLNADEGINMPVDGFFSNQRLSNIYDGPSYQDSNAYLDITTTDCPMWRDPTSQGCMYGKTNAVLRLKNAPGKRDDHANCYMPGFAYLPNAAIAWKQPNGFYYPPAFHSRNLFFNNVDLRHYVINPPFKDGTYLTNEDTVKEQYCTDTQKLFDNWTSIDRQTELTDDDGTLTGLSNNVLPSGPPKHTVSVNDDSFFNAPVETAECASTKGDNGKPACSRVDGQPPPTAKTSPYEYVSTVVFHYSKDQAKDPWAADCSNQACYGVPLYRQYLTSAEMARWNASCKSTDDKKSDKCRWPFIRMAGAAELAQRQTMTMNHGLYYLDTTVTADTQQNEDFTITPKGARLINSFGGGQEYSVFFLYARKSTVQTYLIYVGENFMKTAEPIYGKVTAGRVKIAGKPLVFTADAKTPGITFDRSRVEHEGLLTVKVDFSGLTEFDPTPEALCQPRLFCKTVHWQDPKTGKTYNECRRALSTSDPMIRANRNLADEIDAACSRWAVKDLDCPENGCLGFSVTLPDAFVQGQYKRPPPEAFPDWAIGFQGSKWEPDDKQGGQCYYDPQKPPVSDPCR